MPGDLNLALQQAQAICWDEGYGYRLGGEADSYADGVDCSGLVWKTLHDNGFSVGSYRFDTSSMGPILVSAGFTEMPYSSDYVPVHGDIVVMNHHDTGLPGDESHGHTCYICENITAYVHGNLGYINCDGTTGICALAKVEASGTRGHITQGDHDNGHGAYTEVWCHTYSNLFTVFDPNNPNSYSYYPSEVKIYRLGGYIPPVPDDEAAAALFLLFFGKQSRHRPRR